MKKLKLKRLTLDELAELLPVIEKREQIEYMGGTGPGGEGGYQLNPHSISCDSANISCAVGEIADLFRSLKDSSSYNLRYLTGSSYSYTGSNLTVIVGGDTIKIKAIDAAYLGSHYTINTSLGWSVQTNNHDRDIFKFASVGTNAPALYITVDKSSTSLMESLLYCK